MAYIQTANRTIDRSPHVAAIGEINRLVKRAFDVAGRERARRVVETAVATRTCFSNAALQNRARGKSCFGMR